MKNVILKSDSLLNPTLVRIIDRKKRKIPYNNKSPVHHKKNIRVINEMKLHRMIIQDTSESRTIEINHTVIKNLLNSTLLYFLLLLYIIIVCKNINIQEIKKLSNGTSLEKNTANLILNVLEIKRRIMAETSSDQEKSAVTQLDLRDPEKDPIPDFPMSVSEICNDYVMMTQELKNRIFFHAMEFNTFFTELNQKKEMVKIYAPELLSENDDEDLRNAKILNYYTENINANSKISVLIHNIELYRILLHYFEVFWLETNIEQKIIAKYNVDSFLIYLKGNHPHGYMACLSRLDHLYYTLETNQNKDGSEILMKEKRRLYIVKFMCHKYSYILNKTRWCNYSMKCSYLPHLYKIEKKIKNTMLEFYELYKWKIMI